ncbi:uracil-DNA glycosylase [Carnobacterium gallinarum]|uniref:uracil-DNA glycosylase n=1 Tax=Carnobacterium gallinarum TaxID=2749 RepID=UPI00055126A1|nr:uracil-DNA glycosylase [Carnobacterium gallinarum]
MKVLIHNDWQGILEEEFTAPYYQNLRNYLKKEYQEQRVYPDMYHIWQAFEWTPYEKVKVVILGQDPYHGPNQAHGLSFSVQPNVKVPPSLVNIYQELESDLGIPPVQHGYLKSWAEQGVLLMNTVLTVRAGQANSHRGQGWEQLTDAVIRKLNQHKTPLVFILWGSQSIAKKELIDTGKHVVIASPHPSPLSAYRGFFGSKPFSKANAALIQFDATPINWQLPQNVN